MHKKIIMLFVLMLILVSASYSNVTVFFFNPDAEVADAATMVRTSMAYFNAVGSSVRFQPVARHEAMTNLVTQQKQAKAFIIAIGMIDSLGGGINQVLVPVNEDGNKTFTKIVLAREGDVSAVDELAGKAIASTSVGQDSLRFLNEYLFSTAGYDVNSSRVIFVGKDLDALLAVRFGQVQAAVIAAKNFDRIAEINPVAVTGVNNILTSKEISESPLCVVDDLPADQVEEIKKVFLDMHNHPAGQEFLKTLGFSEWLVK
jgi:ABC-type phosphate/phosphonate transport system substrate-binding protein